MSKKFIKKNLFDFPEALILWNYEKNTELDPHLITASSHRVAHWKCPNGSDHEWEARVFQITRCIKKGGKPCPICSGHRVVNSNCLFTKHPKIAQSWHSTKNGVLTPLLVTSGSNLKVWWQCPESDDHEWEANINNRVKQGCPFCAGKRASKTNNLEVLFPEIAKEWHPTKNDSLLPSQVTGKSCKKVIWLCSEGHEYPARICHRTDSESRCPFCTGHQLTFERSLIKCNPCLATEFHPTKNGSLTAADVFISSGKTYWWLCGLNNTHEWLSTVDNRQKGNGCPYCNGTKVMPEDSFAHNYPDLLQEWDYNLNTKNPSALACKSNLKIHWKCKNKEYHLWSATVASRTGGNGCPYCSGQRLHKKDSAFFQLPEKVLSEFIQKLNPTVDLKNISIFSEKSLIWKCVNNSEHKTWKARLKTRMQGKNNCPECEPHSTRIPYEKSVAFLHPHLIKEWHPDNIFNPSQLKAHSSRIVKWICQFKNHTYEASVAQRVKGHGCPKCRNAPTLPELRLFAELSLFFPSLLHHKLGKDNVDIYLSNINVAIEWDSEYYHLNRFESDERKTQSLLRKGIRVLRIRNSKLKEISIINERLIIISYAYEDVNYELIKEILTSIVNWKLIPEANIALALIHTKFNNTAMFETLKINRGRHVVGRSLNETHPIVAKFWHSQKNGQLTTNEVMAFSKEIYWWQCPECKTEWYEKISNVTRRNDVCSSCSKQKAGSQHNLLKEYPEIARELIDADPTNITPYSNKRYTWKCSKCTYEWKTTVNDRTGKGKKGCPRCAGKVLTYENSIAGVSPEAIKAWDYEKNSKKPEEVFPGTHVKYFFKCSCGTSMEKRPMKFIYENQRRCSACLKKRR